MTPAAFRPRRSKNLSKIIATGGSPPDRRIDRILTRIYAVPVAAHRPIITLTSDFGLSDAYVASMKAVLIRHCPQARLIDVTHQVPRQQILCGSITPERAIDGFPPGTVHLAVVDPGVGTDRRILIVDINRQRVVCPDNGLITWSWRLHKAAKAHELTWRPKTSSHTFHGRDIMVPAAARLACGETISSTAQPIDDPILLNVAPTSTSRGRIIHLDIFGNATTNISQRSLQKFKEIKVKGKKIGKLRRTYWDVAPGKPLALIGSSGLLEIAVRDGSAAEKLKLKVGDEVFLATDEHR
jgi:S-adenosylmethionine hydrolase